MYTNRKGVSLMVGYALLIVIAIGLAAIVYPFLKARLPEDRVECPADLSISIEEVLCNRADWSVTVRMLNRGLFNITGAYIRFAEADKSVRPQINTGKELFLTGSTNPRPLGPGQRTPPLSYQIGSLSHLPPDGDFIVEVQPAIYRKRVLVPCSNKIVTQTVKCISQLIGWRAQEDANEIVCEGDWDGAQNCEKVHDGNWETYGTVASGDKIATYYANYTTPQDASLGSNWTIKFGDDNYSSIDIPYPCWNSETIQFKVDIDTRPTEPQNEFISFSCFNGSEWKSLQTNFRGLTLDLNITNFYEEKVWWRIRS